MALKATELCLGNWIRMGGNTLETYKTYKPVRVTIDILTAIQEENEERPDAVLSIWQPITITEDILNCFGFEETYRSEVRIKFDLNCDHIGYDFLLKPSVVATGFRLYGQYIKCQFVHELQNIYFIVEKKELKNIKQFPGA